MSESVCAKERMEAREAGMCVVLVAPAPHFHSVYLEMMHCDLAGGGSISKVRRKRRAYQGEEAK